MTESRKGYFTPYTPHIGGRMPLSTAQAPRAVDMVTTQEAYDRVRARMDAAAALAPSAVEAVVEAGLHRMPEMATAPVALPPAPEAPML